MRLLASKRGRALRCIVQTLLSAFIIQWLLAKKAQQWNVSCRGFFFNVMDVFEREKPEWTSPGGGLGGGEHLR